MTSRSPIFGILLICCSISAFSAAGKVRPSRLDCSIEGLNREVQDARNLDQSELDESFKLEARRGTIQQRLNSGYWQWLMDNVVPENRLFVSQLQQEDQSLEGRLYGIAVSRTTIVARRFINVSREISECYYSNKISRENFQSLINELQPSDRPSVN